VQLAGNDKVVGQSYTFIFTSLGMFVNIICCGAALVCKISFFVTMAMSYVFGRNNNVKIITQFIKF